MINFKSLIDELDAQTAARLGPRDEERLRRQHWRRALRVERVQAATRAAAKAAIGGAVAVAGEKRRRLFLREAGCSQLAESDGLREWHG